MKIVDVTYSRAGKFFWGLMWRTWVVILPVFMGATLFSFWFLPAAQPGGLTPGQMPFSIGTFFLIWLSMMSTMLFLQLVALRWTFKTKWSDFHFIAVSSEEEKKVEA